MTEPYIKEPSFFEKPLYKYGVPALLVVLLIALYLYTVSDPILDETTALKAVPEKLPDPEAGKLLYLQHCSRCHGVEGEGTTEPIFKSSETGKSYRAASFQDKDFISSRSPVQIFSAVSNGMSDVMPGFKQRISEERTWDIVYYTVFISKDREILDKSELAFRKYCSKCHGRDGLKIKELPDIKRSVKYSDDELALSFASDAGPIKNKAHREQKLDKEEVLVAVPFVRLVPFLDAQ